MITDNRDHVFVARHDWCRQWWSAAEDKKAVSFALGWVGLGEVGLGVDVCSVGRLGKRWA